MASPLYTAPGELLTAIIAYLPAFAGSNPAGLTPGFHPRMVPSSVAKRKMAGALAGFPAALKPDRMNAPGGLGTMLKTAPVGVPPVPNRSARLGIETIRDWGVPAVL